MPRDVHPQSHSQPDVHITVAKAGQPQPDQPSAQGVPAPGSAALAQHDIVPLFHRPELQQLARENNIEALATAIKATNRQNYCPECNQKLTHPKYMTRHALKMHPHLNAVQQSVESWLTAKFRPSSPCKWCHEAFATRSHMHIVSCSVMWTCGQLVAKYGSLKDRSQTTLQDVYPTSDSTAGRGSGRVCKVLGLHEAGRQLPPELDGTLSHPLEGATGPPGLGGRRGQAEEGSTGSSGICSDHRSPKYTTGGSGEVPEDGWQRGAEGDGDSHRRGHATGDGVEHRTGAIGQRPRERTVPGATAPPRSRRWPDTRGQRGSNQGGHGNWWGARQQQWPKDDHRDRDRNDRETDAEKALRKEVKELKNVVKAMGRLTLRLEDRQAVDMLDKEFFLFLQTENSGNSWSVTKRLYTVASEWNRLKETEPESITQPLRSVLLHAFLTALQTQILNIESDANLHQQATAKGLLQDDAYSYLHWNHKTKQHDKAPQQPIDHQALKQCVELMLKLIVFPNTIGNFHPLRKHTANLSSEVLPFALVIQNRNQEAHQLCCCFQHLSRNSCMHLVGATLRPAKLGRTPAAEYLDRLIHDI